MLLDQTLQMRSKHTQVINRLNQPTQSHQFLIRVDFIIPGDPELRELPDRQQNILGEKILETLQLGYCDIQLRPENPNMRISKAFMSIS